MDNKQSNQKGQSSAKVPPQKNKKATSRFDQDADIDMNYEDVNEPNQTDVPDSPKKYTTSKDGSDRNQARNDRTSADKAQANQKSSSRQDH